MLFFTAPLLYAARCKWPSFRNAEPVSCTLEPVLYVKILTRFSPPSPPLSRSHTVRLLPHKAFLCLPTRENLIQVSFSIFYRAPSSGCIHACRSHFKTSFHLVKKQPFYPLPYTILVLFYPVYCIFSILSFYFRVTCFCCLPIIFDV